MGEPNLLTEDQYFKLWAKYNPESEPFNEMEETFMAILFALGFNIIVAAEIYGYGHSRSGPRLLIAFVVVFVVCLLLDCWVKRVKRRRYDLWKQRFPYDPEREFPEDHFKQER